MDCFCRKDSTDSRFWGIFTYFWRKDKLRSLQEAEERRQVVWPGVQTPLS